MRPIVLKEPPRRVLLVKPSALGDVVHTLPVAALLKRAWPEAHLTWLISRPFAPLLETNPHVDEVLHFDRERGGGVLRHSGNVKRLSRQLRESRFDLVIDLQGLFRSGWLTWRTGAPVRVGLASAREGAPMFYTHRIVPPAASPRDAGETRATGMGEDEAIGAPSYAGPAPASRGDAADAVSPRDRHAVERYLDVAEALGLGRAPVEFPLRTTEQDDASLEFLLGAAGADRYAVLLPGTNWPTKRWPAQYFGELAARIDNELDLRPVIAGGPDATAAGVVIRSWHPQAVDLVGKTSIRQLVVLLRGASLVVTNDSGPMHLAAALGVPVVAAFGPTSPLRTGPWGRPQGVVRLNLVCEPCFSRTCLHQSCLVQLDTKAVFDRCREVLSANRGHLPAGPLPAAGGTIWSLPTQ